MRTRSGRWLVAQAIADPAQLAIVGWSHGGYAALQSAVADASVFKAVAAIAPVTDLVEFKESYRRWSSFNLAKGFIGEGPVAIDGSPARNASKIEVPVLLFHGTDDINVSYVQSQLMDRSLAAAGVRHELVTFEHLDHYLEDSAARTELLRRSEAFLREAFRH